MGDLVKEIVELYKRVSYNLPTDVESALKKVDEDILDNIELAKDTSPLCQDTGLPIFFIKKGKHDEKELREIINKATRIATKEVPLRPNSVDSITGENSEDNTGINIPEIHFEESEDLKITLLMKGGGCENTGMLYSLPSNGAERDLEGIRRVVLDAVVNAQGKWCPPGIIGVAIGGSRSAVTKESKKQTLRKLDDKNEDLVLYELEKELTKEINTLGIGVTGMGGKTTCLGVKIKSLHRHPASFFVDVSFLCWAARKGDL